MNFVCFCFFYESNSFLRLKMLQADPTEIASLLSLKAFAAILSLGCEDTKNCCCCFAFLFVFVFWFVFFIGEKQVSISGLL